MQSRRPDASTSFATISFSRAVRPEESYGILTSLNFATRAARSGATTNFADTPGGMAGFAAAEDCAHIIGPASMRSAGKRAEKIDNLKMLLRIGCRVACVAAL